MVTQKPISVRLEITSDHWLDNVVFEYGTPKNRLINEAVRLYIRLRQSRKRAILTNSLDEWDEAALKIDATWSRWK